MTATQRSIPTVGFSNVVSLRKGTPAAYARAAGLAGGEDSVSYGASGGEPPIPTLLEVQGVEVHAYGAVSGGAKFCKLLRLDTPVSQSIKLLLCVGAGGCRHGAYIRALAANAPELEMTKPIGARNLTIFTDGDPSYLSIGRKSVFATLHQ